MSRHLFHFVNNLQIRWKMLVVVLPLVVLPIFLIGALVGRIATNQATKAITASSRADLDHLARFTLDLLDSHYQQFQVYRQDKQETVRQDLKTLVNLAVNLVEAEQLQVRSGKISLAAAHQQARQSLKQVSIGDTGYIYAMNSAGVLTVHLAREGESIFQEQDETGHFFIQDICRQAVNSQPGEVLFATYPWRNAALGDAATRMKLVAFRYVPEWDWIIAAGGYLNETSEDFAFERRAFADLKEKIKSKKIGASGYIFCMDREGVLQVHPEEELTNVFARKDQSAAAVFREMLEKRDGWIRYAWQQRDAEKPRMKLVRYRYFQPWDWIVAVGSYEDEFYRETDLIKWRILENIFLVPLIVGLVAVGLVFLAAKVLTDPIQQMTETIRLVKRGRFDARIEIDSQDEIGELAAAFNRMTALIRQHQQMEANLAHQEKMASLGVLSSGVAHEINNPLGVILGYAAFLEKKIPEDDPNYRFIHEIKRESKRCKKIVQDLLSFARTPKPVRLPTDLNELLSQIAAFATNHTDMHHVSIIQDFDPQLEPIEIDGDQIRQVAINLILNAGAAMERGGVLKISSGYDENGQVIVTFWDNGAGISEENLGKIFEPFFTTRASGTGLGLAITKQIIDQHQGQISIASTPGVGTMVTLRFFQNPKDDELCPAG
jgi:two-component system, NtrC family, sensor kinase